MTTIAAPPRAALPDGLPGLRRLEPMSRHTSFRIGGPADAYLHVHGEAQLAAAASLAWDAGTAVDFVGAGSNLLVADGGVAGLVVETRHNRDPLDSAAARELPDGRRAFWVYSGVPLPRMAATAAKLGLSGLEWATGVPGTVGGGVVNNAGAHGSDMAGVVVAVRLWHRGGPREVPATALAFTYRSSALRLSGGPFLGAVVLAAEIAFTPAPPAAIAARTAEFGAYRRATQPRESSVGSIFKNPPGDAAGRLIERAGVKGLRCGDAQISTKHANFIVNRGHARAADVVTLIRSARSAVLQEFGVELELEIQPFGRWAAGEAP